jgi:protoheme IX farnesyltransferase
MLKTIKHYYRLAKPERTYANLFTTASGFLFAVALSLQSIPWLLFVETLLGTLFVIASSCVINNHFDRAIDAYMERTKNRASVVGHVSKAGTLAYAATLGILGFVILLLYTNTATTISIAAGFIIYVLFYGVSKRKTTYGTIIGSFAGATPILAGYVAVTGSFDLIAYTLFIIMALWQMPHFYAIAIYRLEDYRRANIPVLPAVIGAKNTKRHIALYIIAFTAATLMLFHLRTTGIAYATLMLLLGLSWLVLGSKQQAGTPDEVWARSMFHYSLVVLITFCIALPLGVLLP